jgi:hypothetical protein
MPFQSKAQQRWAFATEQPFAEEWASKTKRLTRLPEKVGSQGRKPRGVGGGGQWAGYVASPLHRDRSPPQP